jgi:general secretion pathway protein G
VAAKQQIENFQLALGQYHLDTGAYPSTEQGLAALRTQPSGVEQWHGPYLLKGCR